MSVQPFPGLDLDIGDWVQTSDGLDGMFTAVSFQAPVGRASHWEFTLRRDGVDRIVHCGPDELTVMIKRFDLLQRTEECVG